MALWTNTNERQVDGFRHETCPLCRPAHQPNRLFQLEIHELSAMCADGMVVTVVFAVIATRGIAEGNFTDQVRLFQIAE